MKGRVYDAIKTISGSVLDVYVCNIRALFERVMQHYYEYGIQHACLNKRPLAVNIIYQTQFNISIYSLMLWETPTVPAIPSWIVTTTFPAVFITVESSSLSPAANTISFCTNAGGADAAAWSLLSSELSHVEPVSLSESSSVSKSLDSRSV